MHTAATPVMDAVLAALARCLSSVTARSVIDVALRRVGMHAAQLEQQGLRPELLAAIEQGLAMFARDPAATRDCMARLAGLSSQGGPAADRPLEVPIDTENDVVAARVHARALAAETGFDPDNCIRVVTAVSELARNIQRYAGRGCVTLRRVRTPRPGLSVLAVDQGPGIPHIDDVLNGNYKSKTGMGLGLRGCRKLMDEFSIETAPGRGTTVRATKYR